MDETIKDLNLYLEAHRILLPSNIPPPMHLISNDQDRYPASSELADGVYIFHLLRSGLQYIRHDRKRFTVLSLSLRHQIPHRVQSF